MRPSSLIWIFPLLILTFLCRCEKSTGPKKDTTPPAAITDLRIVPDTETPVTLAWTAPGDDGNKGTAACYAIRYCADSTVLKQWYFALPVADEPLPNPAGTKELHTVGVPPIDSIYYFGIKSQDEAGNWSPLSNIASGFGLAIGGIAFVSNRDGNDDIYVVSPDGSHIKNVTRDESYDWHPVWSWDRRIAYSSYQEGNSNIYVTDADGSNKQRLTYGSSAWDYSSPVFSPDGSKIAFEADSSTFCGSFYSDVYVMNSDGTNLRNLTRNTGPVDFAPAWSPDGTRIVFVSDRDGNDEIYTMNADGTNHQRLTQEDGRDLHPVWSPDGTRILFGSERDGGWNVYVMSADGSNQRRLTSDNGSSFGIWSPDGSKIAYVSYKEQKLRMFVMNQDGSNQQKLTSGLTWAELAWSPEGKKIAFVGGQLGAEEIFVINADGTNLRDVSSHEARDLSPAWSAASTSSLWPRLNPHPKTFEQIPNGFSGWQLRSLCFTMAF